MGERLKETRSTLRTDEADLKKSEAKEARLKAVADRLNLRKELLDNEAAVSSLHKELTVIEKELKDLPKREGEQKQLQKETEQLLKGIRPDLDLAGADRLRHLLNNRKWTIELAKQHGLLEQKADQAQETLRDLEAERQTLQSKLEAQGTSPADVANLKTLVATVRKEGDLEKRLTESQKRERAEVRACDKQLARLGRFQGTLDALATA